MHQIDPLKPPEGHHSIHECRGELAPGAAADRPLLPHVHDGAGASGPALLSRSGVLGCQGRDRRTVRGVYRRAEAPETAHADLPAVCARAPRGVVSDESALALLELTDDIPAAVNIAVPRGTRR